MKPPLLNNWPFAVTGSIDRLSAIKFLVLLTAMEDKNLSDAANAFGCKPGSVIAPVSSGLINTTFIVGCSGRKIVLQRINSHVFKKPRSVISNYIAVYDYLKTAGVSIMPAPVQLQSGEFCFTDNASECWRATAFVENSSTHSLPASAGQAGRAALCFGQFTMALNKFDVTLLEEIIPGFHDLESRYKALIIATQADIVDRKEQVAVEIGELIDRNQLVRYYQEITVSSSYRKRVMHHDAKISNILFHLDTERPICLVDFDTMQPGYFFSDIGDMVRSMTCSHPEDSTEFEAIRIRPEYYRAIVSAYLEALSGDLSREEIKNIHYAGLIMIYMQALRYLTDFLEGDRYYHIAYTLQNLDRTKNQLALLKQLEAFLENEYSFTS